MDLGALLDDLGLRSLTELPPLTEIERVMDLEQADLQTSETTDSIRAAQADDEGVTATPDSADARTPGRTPIVPDVGDFELVAQDTSGSAGDAGELDPRNEVQSIDQRSGDNGIEGAGGDGARQ